MYENYLSHHGVKGMRWHHRRWQNPDGSLTPAGREHYGYGEERSETKSTRDQIKIMREENRAKIKMMRAENKSRMKYERAKQKEDAKLQKMKNAEKEKKAKEAAALKAQKDKEKAAREAKELAEQRAMLEEFKKTNPHQYKKLKKYLTKDGVLNDAGKALFFGNGQRKTITQMSNEDLKKSAERLKLETQYKQAEKEWESANPSTKKKILAAARKSGAEFAINLGARSLTSLIASGGDFNAVGSDFVENTMGSLRSAYDSFGRNVSSSFGLRDNVFRMPDTRSLDQRIADEVSSKVETAMWNVRVNAETQARVNAAISNLRDYTTDQLNNPNLSSGERQVLQNEQQFYRDYRYTASGKKK